MKKTAFLLVISLTFFCMAANGQATTKLVASFPDNVNAIISASCTPCHTNDGGSMAKSKLNFSNWANYTPEKQKAKAEKMYSELNKGDMPPKAARKKRPDLIPTSEQIDIIKKWSETFASSKK